MPDYLMVTQNLHGDKGASDGFIYNWQIVIRTNDMENYPEFKWPTSINTDFYPQEFIFNTASKSIV